MDTKRMKSCRFFFSVLLSNHYVCHCLIILLSFFSTFSCFFFCVLTLSYFFQHTFCAHLVSFKVEYATIFGVSFWFVSYHVDVTCDIGDMKVIFIASKDFNRICDQTDKWAFSFVFSAIFSWVLRRKKCSSFPQTDLLFSE